MMWIVPADRMKAGKRHRGALSEAAMAILNDKAEHREGDFVFGGASTGQWLSNMAMTMVLRRMRRENVTVHGFRSTFRDWAADCTDFPRELAELALAHTVGDKVEAAYRRGDGLQKRRLLAQEWASYCVQEKDGPAGVEGAAKVVPLRRKNVKAA